MCSFSLYSTIEQSLFKGCSIIPLRGGENLTTGKYPALEQWSTYQLTPPTLAELHQWFEIENHSAYGVICGQVSGFVTLDIDAETTLSILQAHCPQLLETYTVQSGGRSLPHLYWGADFPVKTRKLLGADLKGEGSYVVGAGSEIAGKHWSVAKDLPVRQITPEELQFVVDLLKLPNNKIELVTQENPYYLSKLEIQEAYELRVANSKHRNDSLFQAACLARDTRHSEKWTIETLADLHVQMPAQDEHPPESQPARYHEAVCTIASAFNEPPRPFYNAYVDEPASRLPNALREMLLHQKDGTAILRVLEGLILQEFKAGDLFTENQLVTILKDVVGHYSIRKALKFQFHSENPLIEPFFWFCPTYKNACFCNETGSIGLSALAGGGSEGEDLPHRRKIWYEFPSIEAICDLLDVKLRRGDPIFAKDLQSAKDYRQALERELIKRRPGQYTQRWLASRLGVSDRTIRRYHKAIPIHSCKMYDERFIHRWNIDTLPHDDEKVGGWALIDEDGKLYPASYEIAQWLLRKGHEIHLRIQQGNYYWHGDGQPEKEQLVAAEDTHEPIFPPVCVMPIGEKQSHASPASNQPYQLEVLTTPSPYLGVAVVYVRSLDQLEQFRYAEEETILKADRYYLQPLTDSFQEYVAQDVYANIDELSIYNARRLVDLYGTAVVSATLRKTVAMVLKGKVNNPAGFMVTATQVAWREKYGTDKLKPEFKVQPPRQKRYKAFNIEKDSLAKSEKWLRWRIQFAYQMRDTESIKRWQARLEELGLPEEKFTDFSLPNKGELPY